MIDIQIPNQKLSAGVTAIIPGMPEAEMASLK
jgi:hypothetical protein